MKSLFLGFLLVGGIAAALEPFADCKTPITMVAWLTATADPRAVAERNGFRYFGPVGRFLPSAHEYVVACADDQAGGHNAVVDRTIVARTSARMRGTIDPDIITESVQRKTQKHTRAEEASRDASVDGYAPKQWHLMDDGNAATVHVLGAWRRGHFGRGSKVVIVDDGLDIAHSDITRGCDRGLSCNYNSGNQADPTPQGDESHGTGAGGVAAASGARYPPGAPTCGHGVAPLASIVGVRVIAEPSSEAEEARALTRGASDGGGADIYSCSWGPSDNGATLEAPGTLVRAAIDHGARDGREGRGCLYAWAAGNGHNNGDSCAYDGYASNPHTIAVAAATHMGKAAWYSEACPAVFVTAPSSGDGRSITTTDIHGNRGSSRGDCNTGFGGTSAAAPLVAGVLALVLGVEPQLTARDAMRILAASARRIDVSDPSWQRNAAGKWHSPKYGFGVVDAEAAVVLAETWNAGGLGLAEWGSADGAATGDLPRGIPDAGAGVRSQIMVPVSEAPYIVEGATATVTVRHARRGDLRFVLTSPGGSRSVFEPRPGDRGRDFAAWPLYSVAHWGEHAAGTWELAVEDVVLGTVGQLVSWQLHLYGR